MSDPTSTDDAADPEAERPLIQYGSLVAEIVELCNRPTVGL